MPFSPRIRIHSGLPFRFSTTLGEMELRKGPVASGSEIVTHYLEVGSVDNSNAWRLGEDDGLQPGYESILNSGYKLVDLENPACDKSLVTILETLANAPGVEPVPAAASEEIPIAL